MSVTIPPDGASSLPILTRTPWACLRAVMSTMITISPLSLCSETRNGPGEVMPVTAASGFYVDGGDNGPASGAVTVGHLTVSFAILSGRNE